VAPLGLYVLLYQQMRKMVGDRGSLQTRCGSLRCYHRVYCRLSRNSPYCWIEIDVNVHTVSICVTTRNMTWRPLSVSVVARQRCRAGRRGGRADEQVLCYSCFASAIKSHLRRLSTQTGNGNCTCIACRPRALHVGTLACTCSTPIHR